MARQGKLSGSPFQIENQFRKYAIEHESYDCHFGNDKPNCKYFQLSSNGCSLYNSGLKQCAPHKCKYHRHELRRKNTCNQCAFFFGNKCYYKFGRGNTNPLAAAYCCFFNDNAHDYPVIQKKIEIALISKDIERCQKAISCSRKYIRQAQCELKSPKTREEDISYLRAKIDTRLERISSKQEEIANLQKRLSDLSK